MRKLSSLLAAALCALASSSAAAQSEVTAVDGATVVPVDGSLYTVSNGQFRIQADQTVNITDENVIFKFTVDDNDRMWCYANGGYHQCANGGRMDFKSGRPGFNPRLDPAPFESMAECYIDVVALIEVKGAPTSATFRLSCY